MNKTYVLVIVFISVLIIAVLMIKKGDNISKDQDTNSDQKEISDANYNIAKANYEVVFSKRDKERENFLFLDFWNNMSKNEYGIIKDSLIKSGKLQEIEYKLRYGFAFTEKFPWDNGKLRENSILFDIQPEFFEDRLVKIDFDYKGIEQLINSEYISTLDSYDGIIINLLNEKYGKCNIEKLKDGYQKIYTWSSSKKIIVIVEGFVKRGSQPFDNLAKQLNVTFDKNSLMMHSFYFSYYEKRYYEKMKSERKSKTDDNNQNVINKANETKNEI